VFTDVTSKKVFADVQWSTHINEYCSGDVTAISLVSLINSFHVENIEGASDIRLFIYFCIVEYHNFHARYI